MNLVKDIVDRFSGDLLGRISSLLNTDEDSAGYAASAAVPALLAGLSGVAQSEDGVRKLAAALNGVGSSSVDEVAGMLRADADAVAQRGTNLLGSLFGDGMVSHLAGMLGRYSGLASDSVKKLLALLTPMVLGKVASVWKAHGATPQALTNLFAEQRANIAEAMPPGISLADMPGWSTAKNAASTASATGRRAAAAADTATSSAANWAVPVALGALALLAVWAFTRNRPDEPAADRSAQATREVTAQKPVVTDGALPADVARFNDDLRGLATTAENVLGEINDAASAEAARPKLEELSSQVDTIKSALARLPAAGVDSVRTMADESIATIRNQAEKTLTTPGLPEQIRMLINQFVRQLAELFAPPTP
jgi:hypothetical protein